MAALRRFAWAFTAGGALFFAGEAAAAEPPAETRVARLVKQLGADSFAERTQASDELSRLGGETKSALENAARSDDPEIRLRAQELLKKLRLTELWAPSPARLQARGEKASKVLPLLAERTGNRLMVGDQYATFRDGDVNLDVAAGSFWEVLDEVCRQTDNHVRPHYDAGNPGLVVVAGPIGRAPVAYAGPVRASLTSARREFHEELNYQDGDAEQGHSFQLGVHLMWEDRFRLIAYRSQPIVESAVTDTGVKLSATPPTGNGWNVAGQGTRQTTALMRMQPPPLAAKKLDTLVLRWGLIAVGDMSAIEATELKAGRSFRQDDLKLTIEQFETGAGDRFEATIVVRRDLAIPEPQDVVFQENHFELFDDAGRPYRLQSQTSSLSDEGARIRLSFLGKSEGGSPKTLRCLYPRLRAQHDLAITFRNVPLPAARPD